MVGDVQPEHLLLEAQPGRLVELDLGDGHPLVEGGSPGAPGVLEQAHHALVPFSPALQGGVDDLLEHLQQALAGMAEGVEGAALDEGFDAALVQHRGVHPFDELVERGERAVAVALVDDERDQPFADVADGRQPERDQPAAPRRQRHLWRGLLHGQGGEVRRGQVDVRGQDLDAHGPAVRQVHRGLLQAGLDAGEQAGQVLHRVVGLQVGRLVGDEPVAEGVALGEGVVGEALDDVEQPACRGRGRIPWSRSRRRTWPAPWPSARGSSCRRPCAGCRRRPASSRRSAGSCASPTPGRSSARRCRPGPPRRPGGCS